MFRNWYLYVHFVDQLVEILLLTENGKKNQVEEMFKFTEQKK
jgi:hypothetical protein